MKIAIIGAGIVGVTSAYELALDGHQVQVFERRASAAEETSFANAGVIAPGYVTPWAAPGMPTKVIKHLFSSHSPVRLKLPWQHGELGWMRQWLKACDPEVYAVNRTRLQKLATFSQERLQKLTTELGLEYDTSTGYMVLLRSEQELALAQSGLQILKDNGFAHKVIAPDAARLIEPALNSATTLHAAIHLPNDRVANCRQFALLLKDKALQMGVKFHFGRTVHSLSTKSNGVSHAKGVLLKCDEAVHSFDHVVVCAGVDSTRILKPLGIHLPLIPVYGYSISAPVRESFDAPQSGVMDERYKVAISRIGNRVRVAGGAEIGGRQSHINPKAIQTLYKVLDDWFPAAADTKTSVQIWKGARPMMPDGPPRIGQSDVPGVWLNLGHGSSGWALSVGSARRLADLLTKHL